jgi:hypothetical protein
MQPFSLELLTILVLVAVIVAGISFLLVVIVMIDLYCIRNKCCVSNRTIISPQPTLSDSLLESIDGRLTADQSNMMMEHRKPAMKLAVKKTTLPSTDNEKVWNTVNDFRQDQTTASKYDYSSVHSTNNRRAVFNHDRQYAEQSFPVRMQSSAKIVSDGPFIDRQTPYPPGIVERERSY